MSKKKSKSPKVVKAIVGLVVLKGKAAEEDHNGVPKDDPSVFGCSFGPADDRGINLELGMSPEAAAELEVGKTYEASLTKDGDVEFHHHMVNDNHETFAVSGSISGQGFMSIKPEEKGFIEEGGKYSLSFTEIVEEE